MKTPQFPGIHCVLFALFDAAGQLDRAAMRAQVAHVRGAGAMGLTALGLATELGKLTFAERCDLIRWAGEDAGDLPLSVTVAGNSVAEQRALIAVAEEAEADWLILQPPLVGSYSAAEYIAFFAEVAGFTRLPVAVQNAPQYLGRSLSNEDIATLHARCPNFTQIKAETGPVELAGLAERVGVDLLILNGRGGLEMIDSLHAGARGFIVAPDVLPGVRACWDAWEAGDLPGASAAYAGFLPAALFSMASLEHLTCYGKRIFGQRAGLTIHDRAPALRPDAFGLRRVQAYTEGTL